LDDRGYLYGRHYAPHDIAVREMGTGRSRIETAHDLGINFRVARKLPIEDGIHATQMMLPKCWFDRELCDRGLQALRQYHRAYNERTRSFRMSPVHRFAGAAPQAYAEMDYQILGGAVA
jgi:phage terminase large subunit